MYRKAITINDAELLRPLNHVGTNTIETERLILRRFRFSDNEDVFKWASNPKIVRYLFYEPHKTIKDTNTVLRNWVRSYRKTLTIGLLNLKELCIQNFKAFLYTQLYPVETLMKVFHPNPMRYLMLCFLFPA